MRRWVIQACATVAGERPGGIREALAVNPWVTDMLAGCATWRRVARLRRFEG